MSPRPLACACLGLSLLLSLPAQEGNLLPRLPGGAGEQALPLPELSGDGAEDVEIGTEAEASDSRDPEAGDGQFEVPAGAPVNTVPLELPEEGAAVVVEGEFGLDELEPFGDQDGLHWHAWLPEEGLLRIDTFGSNFDTVLTVHGRDEEDGWEELDRNDDAMGLQSRLFIPCEGQEVIIQVSDLAAEGRGQMVLNVALEEEVVEANDHWQNATVVEDFETSFSGNSSRMPADPAEEDWGNGAGFGLWWKFTAPESGDLVLDTNGSNFDTILVSGRPGGGDLPERLERDDDGGQNLCSRLAFSMEEGETVLLMLDSLGGQGGDWKLNLHFYPGGRPRAENDQIATAKEIGLLLPTRLSGLNELAEPDERELGLGAQPDGHGLWWSLEAPRDGRLVLDGRQSTFDLMISVFEVEGDRDPERLANSRDRGWNHARQLSVGIEQGKHYLILVESINQGVGEVSIDLDIRSNLVVPPHDFFAAALDLGRRAALEIDGNLDGAGSELQEPLPMQPGRSVWYRWQAPRTGWVRLELISEDEHRSALIQVFEGDNLEQLDSRWDQQTREMLAEIADEAPWVRNGALVPVRAGDELRFQVVGSDAFPGSGGFRLSLAMIESTEVIPSDDIARAEPIERLPYQAQAWTQLASTEEWEHRQWTSIDQSLWWSYTAPRDQMVEILLEDRRSMSSQLAIARLDEAGEVTLLDRSDTNRGRGGTSWFGSVRAGETIWIGIGAYGRVQALQSLSVREVEPDELPTNDLLAKARDLGEGLDGQVVYDLRFASGEEGEEELLDAAQDTGAIRSVWFRWRAPRDGILELNSTGIGGGRRLAAFAIDPSEFGEEVVLGSLLEHGRNLAVVEFQGADMGVREPQSLRLAVEEGELCLFRLDQSDNGFLRGIDNGFERDQLRRGLFHYELLPVPDGDHSERALDLAAVLPGKIEFDLAAATVEDWEREAELDGLGSLWLEGTFEEESWLRLAPSEGLCLQLFERSEVEGDHPLPRESVPMIEETVLVRVGPRRPLLLRALSSDIRLGELVATDGGEASLEVDFGEPRMRPEHDDLARARIIEEFPFVDEIDIGLAGRESFENQGSRSVWYRFTAPQAGHYLLSTAGSEYDTVLEVYEGDVEPGSLEDNSRQVAMNDDAGGVTSAIEFEAEAGVRFLVRVRSYTTPRPGAVRPGEHADIQFGGSPLFLRFRLEAPSDGSAGEASGTVEGGGEDSAEAVEGIDTDEVEQLPIDEVETDGPGAN